MAGEPAMVFMHGWLMSLAMWDGPVEALQRRTRCLAIQQPGHGIPGPDGPVEAFTMKRWADETVERVRQAGIERAVFVGHSMGGMLALEISRRHPEMVAALGLVSTTDRAWPEERRAMFRGTVRACADAWGDDLAQAMAERLISKGFLESHPGWLERWRDEVASYDRAGIVALGEAIVTRDDMTAHSATLDVPVTVMHGTSDAAIEPAVGREMASRIRGAAFVEVPGTGHCPPLEEPGPAARAMVDLFERATAGA